MLMYVAVTVVMLFRYYMVIREWVCNINCSLTHYLLYIMVQNEM